MNDDLVNKIAADYNRGTLIDDLNSTVDKTGVKDATLRHGYRAAPERTPLIPMGFSVAPEIHDHIVHAAGRLGITISQLCRMALTDYLVAAGWLSGRGEPFVPGDWESKALNPTTPKRDVCTCSCHAEGQCCEECLDQQARLRRECD